MLADCSPPFDLSIDLMELRDSSQLPSKGVPGPLAFGAMGHAQAPVLWQRSFGGTGSGSLGASGKAIWSLYYVAVN